MQAFASWLTPPASAEPVQVLAYDYSRSGDWNVPDAAEVDAARFEAILRSSTRGEVTLSIGPVTQGTLEIALEYFSGAEHCRGVVQSRSTGERR